MPGRDGYRWLDTVSFRPCRRGVFRVPCAVWTCQCRVYQTAELEVINREVALLREAAEAAQLSHTEELERVSALAVRREEEREEEAERAASEAESTRQQLNNAVSPL